MGTGNRGTGGRGVRRVVEGSGVVSSPGFPMRARGEEDENDGDGWVKEDEELEATGCG